MAPSETGVIMVDGVAYAPVASAPVAPVASAPVMVDGRFVPLATRSERYACSEHPKHERNGRPGFTLNGIVGHQSKCRGIATLLAD